MGKLPLSAALLCACAWHALGSSAAITSPSPATGCVSSPGYPDLPLCTVPQEIPVGSFSPQAGYSYTDSNFGGQVTSLTNGSGWIHPYSLPSPFSAHNRYLRIRNAKDGGSHLIDPKTG